MTAMVLKRHILHLPASVFLLALTVVFIGCTEQETPKKVSLYGRSPATSSPGGNTGEDTLQFGFDVILGPKEDVKIFTPFLTYLEETTKRNFHIKFSNNIEDTVHNLGQGVTQFAVMDPLGYVTGREKFGRGIRYLVSGVNNDGDARLHAVIFTGPNSDIQDIEDLRGRSFAFGDKMSMQGHIIPRKMMEDSGINLEDLGTYHYTGSHTSSVSAVLNGEYDAGALQDTLARRLAAEGKIRIVRVSKPYPSQIIACNTDVPDADVNAVESALLAFDPSGRQKEKLIEWDRTDMPLGFVRVTESEFYPIAILARRYGLLTQ